MKSLEMLIPIKQLLKKIIFSQQSLQGLKIINCSHPYRKSIIRVLKMRYNQPFPPKAKTLKQIMAHCVPHQPTKIFSYQ